MQRYQGWTSFWQELWQQRLKIRKPLWEYVHVHCCRSVLSVSQEPRDVGVDDPTFDPLRCQVARTVDIFMWRLNLLLAWPWRRCRPPGMCPKSPVWDVDPDRPSLFLPLLVTGCGRIPKLIHKSLWYLCLNSLFLKQINPFQTQLIGNSQHIPAWQVGWPEFGGNVQCIRSSEGSSFFSWRGFYFTALSAGCQRHIFICNWLYDILESNCCVSICC